MKNSQVYPLRYAEQTVIDRDGKILVDLKFSDVRSTLKEQF